MEQKIYTEIGVDLDNNVVSFLKQEAKEKNIRFNDLIEDILKIYIDNFKKF